MIPAYLYARIGVIAGPRVRVTYYRRGLQVLYTLKRLVPVDTGHPDTSEIVVEASELHSLTFHQWEEQVRSALEMVGLEWTAG